MDPAAWEPLGGAGLVDVALDLLRRHPRPLLTTAGAVVLPTLALAALAAGLAPHHAGLAAAAMLTIGLIVAQVACVDLSSHLLVGGGRTWGAAVRRALVRAPASVLAAFVLALILAAASITVVVPLLLAPAAILLGPALLEGRGPIGAHRRSWSLSAGRRLHLAGGLLLITALAGWVDVGLLVLAHVAAVGSLERGPSADLLPLLAHGATAVLGVALLGAFAATAHVDARVANEGLDLQIQLLRLPAPRVAPARAGAPR